MLQKNLNQSITTPDLPVYQGNPVPLPPIVSNDPNAVAAAKSVVDQLPPGTLTSDAETVAALASTGAMLGSTIPGIGTLIGGIIGTVLGIIIDIIPALRFLALNGESQAAEDALGAMIYYARGNTSAVQSPGTNPTIDALNKLIVADFQSNGTKNWPIWTRQNGLPQNVPTTHEPTCGTVWGIQCVWTVTLHSRPRWSTDTVAPSIYIQQVHEVMMNTVGYLNQINATALVAKITPLLAATNIANGIVTPTQANNALTIGKFDTSSMGGSGIGRVLIIGAGIGLMTMLIKQKEGSILPSQGGRQT